MPERGVVLAVDIGTSATKAVLFDGKGRVLSLARRPYPMATPRPDWAEQDPAVVYAAVLEAIREAYLARPAGCSADAVAFSAQWYSTMPVAADDRALSPYLTWSDRRSAAIADALRRSEGGRRIYQATGCPLDAIYPLSKIIWLQQEELPARPTRFVSIKEYVFRRLFGEYVVDWSMASATGLFDIRRRDWSPEALEVAGIDRTRLSTPVSPYQTFRRWTPEALAGTGLPQGIPCVIGAGDGVLSSVGVGAVGRGVAAVNVGTSAACRYLISTPTIDPKERLWTYALDEHGWVIGGIVSSGGIVYDWFVRQCAGRDPSGDPPGPELHAALNDQAARIPPGAEGLTFLPYLSGEQCPVWDPETTGGFFGLTLRHGRGHLARAVYEGIALSLARVAEALADVVEPIEEVRVTGGLLGSPTWLQIAADMWGTRILVPESPEGSSLGAAVLAWVALGMAPDLETARELVRPVRVVEPDAARHELYHDFKSRAAKLLAVTKSVRGQETLGAVEPTQLVPRT
jgi:gluconokinase